MDKEIEKEVLWLLQRIDRDSKLNSSDEISYVTAHNPEIADIQQKKLLSHIRDLGAVKLGPEDPRIDIHFDTRALWEKDHTIYSPMSETREFIPVTIQRKEFNELLKSLTGKHEKVQLKLEKEGTELQLVAEGYDPIVLHEFAYDSWPDKLLDHLIMNSDETHTKAELIAGGSLPESGAQGVNTYVNKLSFYSVVRKLFFPVCTSDKIKMRKSVVVPYDDYQQLIKNLANKIH